MPRPARIPMIATAAAALLGAALFATAPAVLAKPSTHKPKAAAHAKGATAKDTTPVAAGADKALAAIDAQIAAAGIDKSKPGWKSTLPMPKAVAFDTNHQYFVRMTTNKGEVLIKFRPDVAPYHVTNFIYLTKLGFYDGLKFHRVIPGFMAQGGDPLGNGTGGPGYGFAGEFSDAVRHDKPGMLSMANAGPGTDGSQFFLTFVATPWLNGRHTIFGEVVEGLPTLKALEAAGTESGQTTELLTLDKAVVEVK